jgi:hypothetical protein
VPAKVATVSDKHFDGMRLSGNGSLTDIFLKVAARSIVKLSAKARKTSPFRLLFKIALTLRFVPRLQQVIFFT